MLKGSGRRGRARRSSAAITGHFIHHLLDNGIQKFFIHFSRS
jgi:hypothetical protein